MILLIIVLVSIPSVFASIIPLQLQLMTGNGFSSSNWTWHFSQDLIQRGIDSPALDSQGATGTGGTPSYDVRGSNVTGVPSRAFAFRHFSVPLGLNGLNFGFFSYGFGEMGGEGNRFGAGICESHDCTSNNSPLGGLVFLEVNHCIHGNVSCPPGSWVERLIVNNASTETARTVPIINLTQYRVGLVKTSVDISREASSSWLNTSSSNWTVTSHTEITAYSMSMSNPNQDLVNEIRVTGVHIDQSVLDGYLVDFSASCTICKSGFYEGSWANFADASYTPDAPLVGYLGIEPSYSMFALAVGIGLSVMLPVLVSNRGQKLWKRTRTSSQIEHLL